MNSKLFERFIKRIHRWANRERFRKTEINMTVGLTNEGKVAAEFIGDDVALLLPLIGDSDIFAQLAEFGLVKRYSQMSPLARREKFESLWQMCEGAEQALKQAVPEQLMKSPGARKMLDN